MRTDFAPFLTWCQSKGVTTPLELRSDGRYRYMALPEDKDKLLGYYKDPYLLNVVTVPLEACIVGDTLESLVDKIKYETIKGLDSDYAPWLELLPTLDDFQGMPRFWTSSRIDFVSTYDNGQLQARVDFDHLRCSIDPLAMAIVDSRSNFLPDNTFAMTPMLDMFNHKSDVKTSARVDGANRMVLQVAKDSISHAIDGKKQNLAAQVFEMFGFDGKRQATYKKGSEVCVSYGSFDNIETLCNYGFVDRDNVHNAETFQVRRRGKIPVSLVVSQDGIVDNVINQQIMAELRMSLTTTEEIETLDGREWLGIGSISGRNDLELFGLIAGELEEALYDARNGASEASNAESHDSVIVSYLRGREKTLERARDWLTAKYPQVF